MKSLFIILFYFACFALSKAQYSEETNKMLGIEPREPEPKGAPYHSIKSVFDSIKYYIAYFGENQYGDKKHAEPNISFLFNKLLILTTYPSNDPKSRLRVIGEIDNVTDKKNIYRRLQCIDNSGNYVVLAVCYELKTKVDIIIIVYSNTTYYYEVNKNNIPKSAIDIINNPEIRANFLDSIDLPNNENEISKNFFSQFGPVEKVVKVLCNE